MAKRPAGPPDMRPVGEIDVVERHAASAPQQRGAAQRAAHRRSASARGAAGRRSRRRQGPGNRRSNPSAAAGEHRHVDAVPAQFERLDDAGGAGADDQHRRAPKGSEGIS